MEGFRVELTSDFRYRLFEGVLSRNNLTLKELSKKLGCGYSGIKNWRSGKNLIPESFLNALIMMSTQDIKDNLDKNMISKLDENWGERLGGRNFYKKYHRQIKSRLAHARSFIKQKSFPTMPDNDIWELMGVLLGDGCLSKYYAKYERRFIYEISFTGNMFDDLDFYRQRIIPILREKFEVSGNYYLRPKYHVICIRIRSKRIFNFFRDLGMPVGKKKKTIRITSRMFRESLDVKAAILRGLLDTDGHIFARKDEGYKYPHLEISSGSISFLKDLNLLIRTFGLPAYLHVYVRGQREGGNVLIRGGKNIKLWMERIGSSNPTHINRYNTWLLTGKLLPKKGL
jgi:hypothetical protein